MIEMLKINFFGVKKTGRIKNGKPQYDSPEPLEMSAKEFVHLYDGIAREKIKINCQQKIKQKKLIKRSISRKIEMLLILGFHSPKIILWR